MGYKPYLVKGDDPKKMHKLMAETLDEIISYINKLKRKQNSHI